MRIGVDIDGVLNYREEFVLAYGAKFCVEEGLLDQLNFDITAHSLTKMLGITKEQRDRFWQRYGKYQMWVWPAQKFASEVIHKLRQEGHQIYIITGRNNQDMRTEGMPEDITWEKVTIDWLRQNQIEYDEIAFDKGRPTPNDKGTYCAEHQIDVMVEDLPEYLETLEGKTQILVFDQPYNREVKLKGAERVYAWYDIYAKIQEMVRS